MSIQFFDREEAGRQLARRLSPFQGREDVIVLGLPPGGVIVAAAVARSLSLPLAEFPLSPVSTGRSARPILRDKTVILVDEMVGSGHTLVSAVRAIRQFGPHTIIAAAPAISSAAASHIAAVADRCVAVVIPPRQTTSVAEYVDFQPVSDQQVLDCLHGATPPLHGAASGRHS